MKNEKIKYELLTAEYFQPALNCICEVFLKHEPLTSFLNVNEIEFRPFANDLLIHSLKQDLSWMAIDINTKRLVGVRVVTDFNEDFIPLKNYGSKMDLILKFLTEVSMHSELNINGLNEKMIHSHMVAVKAEYQGAGIAKNLLTKASEWAKLNGYKISVGEVTNKNNHKLLSKIRSYQGLNTVFYKNFVLNGTHPFADLKDHDFCQFFKFNLDDITNPT